MPDCRIPMLREKGIRRRFLFAAIFGSVVVFVFVFAFAFAERAAPQESEPGRAKPGEQAAPLAPTPASTSNAPRYPLGEAMALEHSGDFDAAIKKYQQVLAEKPMSPDAYAGLTRVYLKKKDVTEAYETISKGLQVANGPPVRVALGEVYFRHGKIHEAEKEWADVINSGYASARAYLGLARVRWAIAMNKAAKTMIDKAHDIDPQDPEIQTHWMRTLPRSERIQYYESYLAGPNNSDANERLSLAFYLAYLKDQAKHTDR